MSYTNFKSFLTEAGQDAGKLELVKTGVEEAYEFGKEAFETQGYNMDEEIPDFEENYKIAKSAASGGTTKRKDMPVIDDNDVKQLQDRLKSGSIDVSKPFSKDAKKNPFPSGLSGEQAQKWLEDGLKKNDGDADDDKVSVKLKRIAAKKLKPIQQQIYFDKSIQGCAQFGRKGTTDFLMNNSTFIVSSDNRIIDGHHRYLSALLIDPDMKVECLVIDLPISVLLPMTLSYSDAIGNRRNL